MNNIHHFKRSLMFKSKEWTGYSKQELKAIRERDAKGNVRVNGKEDNIHRINLAILRQEEKARKARLRAKK